MCKEYEDIVNELKVQPGYNYSEMKDIYDDFEKGVIAGYCGAIAALRTIDVEEETDETGSETLDKILVELGNTDVECCVDSIFMELADVLISFGDNHPED